MAGLRDISVHRYFSLTRRYRILQKNSANGSNRSDPADEALQD
jgi:hypothetical protein